MCLNEGWAVSQEYVAPWSNIILPRTWPAFILYSKGPLYDSRVI